MKPFRYEEMRGLLPDLEELRPLRELALRLSRPDPVRTWSAAGELGTADDRIVEVEGLAAASAALAGAMRDHLEALYRTAATATERAASGDASGAAKAMLEAAALEAARGRHERAMAWASAAHRAVEGSRDRAPAGLALRRWGRAARALGDLDEALRRYAAAHGIAVALRDISGAAESAIGAGNVLEDWGRFPEAEEWYRRALDLLDRLPGPVPERWHACLNLHITLRRSGAVDASEPWLQRAEALARALEDPQAPVFLENARGQLRMARDDFEAAGRHFDAALEAGRGPHALVVVRLNLAESLQARGRTLDAAEQARTAEAEAISGGAVVKLPEVYRMLGRFAAQAGHADAFVLFERSLEQAGSGAGQALEVAQTCQAYGEAEAALGHHDRARELLARAVDVYRSLGLGGMRRRWVDCFDVAWPGVDGPAAGPGVHPQAGALARGDVGTVSGGVPGGDRVPRPPGDPGPRPVRPSDSEPPPGEASDPDPGQSHPTASDHPPGASTDSTPRTGPRTDSGHPD